MVFLQLLHPVLHDMLLPMSRTALLKLHVRYPYHTLALLVRRACQVSIMFIAMSSICCFPTVERPRGLSASAKGLGALIVLRRVSGV